MAAAVAGGGRDGCRGKRCGYISADIWLSGT
jgi:hypothetical protein